MKKQVKFGPYSVLETSTIRSQDLRRFTVKKSPTVTYVVAFQAYGASCSCPAGRYQKTCKHVEMVRSI